MNLRPQSRRVSLVASSLMTLALLIASASTGLAQPPLDTPSADSGAAPAEPTGPATDTPELAALAKYAGGWTVELRREGSDRVMRYRANSKWVVQGRYLRSEWTGDDGSGMMLTTFDPDTKQYRRWQFDDTGRTIEFTGEYDRDAGVFTFRHVSRNQGRTLKVESRFTDENTEQWTLAVSDEDGQDVELYQGINRRE